MTTLYDDLEWRGLIKQTTDEKMSEILEKNKFTLYCGFDPTADSLHLGSLLPLLTLKRFQNAGHQVIGIVGGATGMIGDPSGKSTERTFLNEESLRKNQDGIREVIERILGRNTQNNSSSIQISEPKILNNYDWFKDFSFLSFLRMVGKHFTINHMMAKESVRARLEDRDHGISYTEFSYMLLQAYDYYHLYEKEGCTLQIGGSDQWGNITAGIELIRRLNAHKEESHQQESSRPHPYGITFPLVTKSDGTKFGKSEGGSIWLSADKTSPYQFYQFLIQTSDADVLSYLKYFTFLSRNEIEALEKEHLQHPEKRIAQKTLARELTRLVHSEEELKKVEEATSALFNAKLKDLSLAQILQSFESAPKTELTSTEWETLLNTPQNFVEMIVKTNLSPSKGQARKDIVGGGYSLNDEKITDATFNLKSSDLIHQKVIVLKKGKKNYHLLLLK